jgi:hypothetical protein
MKPPDSAPARDNGPGEEVPPVLEGSDFQSLAPSHLRLHASPLLVAAPGAADLCGLSERTWRKLDRTGRNPAPIHVGRRRLWSVSELARWTEAGCPVRDRWEVLRVREEVRRG